MMDTTDPDRKMCKELISETTAHGCRNFMSTNRNKFMRVLWFCCVLGTSITLLCVLYFMLDNYQSYPFNTVVKIGPRERIDFPQITLCDLTYLQTDKFDNPKAVQDVFLAYSAFGPKFVINKTADYIAAENMPLDRAHEVSDVSVYSSFIFCSWRDSEQPCKDMWSPVFTDMGKCFAFNSNHSSKFVANTSGSKGGLHIIAKIFQDGYIVNHKSGAGLKLRLHDAHEDSRIYDSGIYVSPGVASLISVKKKSYKFLEKPFKAYGDEYCVKSTDQTLNNSTLKYDRELCIRECLGRVVMRNCSCRSITDTVTSEYPICTIGQWLGCYLPSLDLHYAQDVSIHGCHCPRVCEFNQYVTTLSSGMFPSVPAINMLEQNQLISNRGVARTNYFDINIFYEDLLLEEIEHVPVYTYTSIMGTVGGQMGLFLGASLITLAELFEICVLFLWSKMKCCFAEKKAKTDIVKVKPAST